jgi:hypothetical protein
MSPDLIRALALSGAILFGVVVLIIVISMVAVRRGETEMAKDSKHHGH